MKKIISLTTNVNLSSTFFTWGIYVILALFCLWMRQLLLAALFSNIALIYAPYAKGSWGRKKPIWQWQTCILHVTVTLLLFYVWLYP